MRQVAALGLKKKKKLDFRKYFKHVDLDEKQVEIFYADKYCFLHLLKENLNESITDKNDC